MCQFHSAQTPFLVRLISFRPLPTPATPDPKKETKQKKDEEDEDEDSHYYESGNVPEEEEEEENHLYDDITEYHRACDMDHEKNGYESGLPISFFYVSS